MPEYCTKCESEILPYLKAGQLKRISGGEVYKKGEYAPYLVSYQLWYCNRCQTVSYKEHERFELKKLNESNEFIIDYVQWAIDELEKQYVYVDYLLEYMNKPKKKTTLKFGKKGKK